MAVMGESKAPGLIDLLRLAADAGVPERLARDSIEAIAAHGGSFAALARDAPIRAATIKAINQTITANRDRLA